MGTAHEQTILSNDPSALTSVCLCSVVVGMCNLRPIPFLESRESDRLNRSPPDLSTRSWSIGSWHLGFKLFVYSYSTNLTEHLQNTRRCVFLSAQHHNICKVSLCGCPAPGRGDWPARSIGRMDNARVTQCSVSVPGKHGGVSRRDRLLCTSCRRIEQRLSIGVLSCHLATIAQILASSLRALECGDECQN